MLLDASPKAQPPADSNAPAKSEVRFDFARTGLPVPKFTIEVKEDGSGTYSAEDKSAPTMQEVHRDFALTPATTKKIFGHAPAIHQDTCASKAKNIADSGTKMLSYISSAATSACTYNYSESKDVTALTDIFQGMAETLDQGRRLDFLHRFDRLGLDDAIGFLTQEVADGRAIEVNLIEPSLRSIAADTQVMTRVRTKAAALLALIPADDVRN
jgi:hypothetical protein